LSSASRVRGIQGDKKCLFIHEAERSNEGLAFWATEFDALRIDNIADRNSGNLCHRAACVTTVDEIEEFRAVAIRFADHDHTPAVRASSARKANPSPTLNAISAVFRPDRGH